jgi:hypothetical protein
MLRRLFNVLSALSLLLCAAVVALWVRSYWVNDRLNIWPAGPGPGGADCRSYNLRSGKGGLAFWISARDGPSAPRYKVTWSHNPAYWYPMQANEGDGNMTRWNRFGFELREYPNWFSFTVPYWSLAAALSALPAMWLTRNVRRRTRIKRGLCPSCGYDLRATPGRCPECGTATTSSPASAAAASPAQPRRACRSAPA